MARKKQDGITAPVLPPDYAEFLESLKARVRQAQTQAMLSVNRELIRLYWEIGREIVQRQEGFPAATCSGCGHSISLTGRRKSSHNPCDNRSGQKSHSLCDNRPRPPHRTPWPCFPGDITSS